MIRWTSDAAAGRVPVFGAWGGPTPCSVQPASAEDVPQNLREADVIYHVVKFYADPSIRNRDEIDFNGRLLVVTGVRATSAGQGRSHVVDAEEKPPHAPLG